MYIKTYTFKGIPLSNNIKLEDPLYYINNKQEKLIKECNINNNRAFVFTKKSRICRNIIIQREVELAKLYDIEPNIWGLCADRALYYLEAFKQLNKEVSLVNFDKCAKENFLFLKAQEYYLNNYKIYNNDIFKALRNTTINPSILELDGMKSLPSYRIELEYIINNKLPKDKVSLLAITSSVGRIINQLQYEKERDYLYWYAKTSREVLYLESIAYAEPRKENGPHYPMRVELIVFNKENLYV